jgi:multimeric flavodoxin WrbA
MKLTVFNGSPRGKNGNTQQFLNHFVDGLRSVDENECEIVHLNRVKNQDDFVKAFQASEAVIIAFPLYCDSMPAMVKTFIESLAPLCSKSDNPNVGFIVQSGFPEAHQSRFIEKYLQKLASRLGSNYIGTIVKGGGHGACEMPTRFKKPFGLFYKLGKTLGETGKFDNESLTKLAQPEKLSKFLQVILKAIYKTPLASKYWDDQLKSNDVYDKRFARPYV